MAAADHHLALYNFGLHVASFESPAVEGFRLREPFNFEAARRAEGFIGRSGYIDEPGMRSWGRRSSRVTSTAPASTAVPPSFRSGATSRA